jgi:hypothetical protein
MPAVEPEVRGEQPFLGRVHGRPAPSEVEQQPLEAEARHQVSHVDPEESLRDEVLRRGQGEALVPREGGQTEDREVLALHKADTDGRLARPLPCDTSLGVHALRDVDQFQQVVLASRVDGGSFRRLERVRVLAKVRCAPGRGRSGGNLRAEPFGQIAPVLAGSLSDRTRGKQPAGDREQPNRCVARESIHDASIARPSRSKCTAGLAEHAVSSSSVANRHAEGHARPV